MEQLNVTQAVPNVSVELKHLLKNEEECNAFIKAEIGAGPKSKRDGPVNLVEYFAIQTKIEERIDSVLKPHVEDSFLGHLFAGQLRPFLLSILFVVAVNKHILPFITDYKAAVLAIEFFALTFVSLVFRRMAERTKSEVQVNNRSLSRYKMTFIWLAFSLMYTVVNVETDYVEGHVFEVIMAMVLVLWVLTCILGDWESRVKMKVMEDITTSMPNDVISDTDLKTLSCDPFIKVWMNILLERNESLTYSALDIHRNSIFELVNIMLNDGEQKRMREIITSQ